MYLVLTLLSGHIVQILFNLETCKCTLTELKSLVSCHFSFVKFTERKSEGSVNFRHQVASCCTNCCYSLCFKHRELVFHLTHVIYNKLFKTQKVSFREITWRVLILKQCSLQNLLSPGNVLEYPRRRINSETS